MDISVIVGRQSGIDKTIIHVVGRRSDIDISVIVGRLCGINISVIVGKQSDIS